MARGEQVLAAAFGLFGVVWILESRDLAYMDEFAPGAGFLPFWLGVALAALAAAVLVAGRRKAGGREGPLERGRPRKVVAISAGLFLCSALVGWLGFALPVAAYLVFLVRGVERRSWTASVGLAAGATAGLFLVFRVWLGVPLPRGPWGL